MFRNFSVGALQKVPTVVLELQKVPTVVLDCMTFVFATEFYFALQHLQYFHASCMNRKYPILCL